MMGPEAGARAARAAAGDREVGVPDFVNEIMMDRQVGLIPVGTEITPQYLREMWDKYENYQGPGTVSNPLTAQNLADALRFLGSDLTATCPTSPVPAVTPTAGTSPVAQVLHEVLAHRMDQVLQRTPVSVQEARLAYDEQAPTQQEAARLLGAARGVSPSFS